MGIENRYNNHNVVDGWVADESLAKAGVVDDVADCAGVVTKDGT